MPDRSWADQLVTSALRGRLPLLLFFLGIGAGIVALQFTPREEEPQIVVPMVTVGVSAPGMSAQQVEHQITTPLEKLLAQITGVEHVYSTSNTGTAEVTLRFFVGEDREDAILNAYNKLYSNQDQLPAGIDSWLIKPIEVDDVPILVLGLWSDDPERYSDFTLRRVGDEISTYLQSIPQTNEVKVIGGRPRQLRVQLNPEAMAARQTTVTDIISALRISNLVTDAGQLAFNNQVIRIESGDRFHNLEDISNAVINVIDGIPVHLTDVAKITDDEAVASSYQWLEFNQSNPLASVQRASTHQGDAPMVTISVAKQRGANAVTVAREVHDMLEALRLDFIPAEIHVETLRDYGVTANDKVNNLGISLAFAVLTVVVFIGIFLGWRHALVVGLAVPICYGITLALDLAFGYSINRVTLFALILSLGLLVDDPITGVDNIERFLRREAKDVNASIVAAMAEIRIPLVVSTVTIVLAFIPLAFITGMMGPYMAPMAFNVPVSVITSTLVAFLVTPWLASKLLKHGGPKSTAAPMLSSYERLLRPVLDSRRRAWWLLAAVLGLFLLACLLPALRLVPMKLLPYDNRNELQILIDMPEGSSTEATAAEARRIAALVKQIPEISALGVYVGTPSPVDFNGLVRRYYQRKAPHLADIRVMLVAKEQRIHQSHSIVLRLRQIIREQPSIANIKVIEVPPGPPVLDTLVAEIYGERTVDYDVLREAATQVMQRLAKEPHVVQIDSSVEARQSLQRFVTDKQKAALSGISTADINQVIAIANQGLDVGYLNQPRESVPVPINLRLPLSDRSSLQDFLGLQVRGRSDIIKQQQAQGLESAPQSLVAIGELGAFQPRLVDQAIHHKDLQPIVYVTADISGRTPAEVIADLDADYNQPDREAADWESRNFLNAGAGIGWQLPPGVNVSWQGEGEWKLTLRVFRDMGLAFVFALIAIFIVLNLQTGSTAIALIIMSAIPLTIIGIMPGFWLLNQWGERSIANAPDPVLFTATAMIGMIALAGIVVRNSVILIDFIEQARKEGETVLDAVLHAGGVRMRPVLLTAGTTLLGNLVIMLDPVFSGLAVAIIFGITSSTLFTLVIVPTVYFLVFDKPDDNIRVIS